MAKLLSFFKLCPVTDRDDFLGLAEDAESECIINTFGRNIAIVTKLSNQKQVCSWTFLEKLSTNVVYDHGRSQYVGVFGGRHIRCWDRSVTDVNKVKRKKLLKNVAHIKPLEHNQTLVLYEDGSCESLELALTRKKDTVNGIELRPIIESPACVEISKVAIFTLLSGTLLLTYFITNTETKSVEFVFGKLASETLTLVGTGCRVRLDRSEQNVTLAGHTVVDRTTNPALFTIWSDRRVFMMSLNEDETSTTINGAGNFVSMFNTISVNQTMSIQGLDKNIVAIYGANSNKDGASLIIYNTSFKVNQSNQFFKIFFDDSRLWVLGSNILLAMSQMIAVVPFRLSREQLCDMVGSQRGANMHVQYVEREYINEDAPLEESMSFNGKAIDAVYDCSAIVKTESKSESLNNCVERFNENMRKLYAADLVVDLNRDATLPPDTVHIALSNQNVGALVMSEKFEMLANELERFGASEAEITDTLIPVLLRTNSSADLAICLQKYVHISDRMLAKALHYAINCPPNDLEDDERGHGSVDLVNVVLSCTFCKNLILTHLRAELSLTDALAVLDHLFSIYTADEVCLNENPLTSECFDDDRQILEWFAVLLDSHYQQFLLSHDERVREILQKWVCIIDKHTNDLQNLNSMMPILRQLCQRNDALNESSSSSFSKWYSVEIVQLY